VAICSAVRAQSFGRGRPGLTAERHREDDRQPAASASRTRRYQRQARNAAR
jgi:hypothetical protein